MPGEFEKSDAGALPAQGAQARAWAASIFRRLGAAPSQRTLVQDRLEASPMRTTLRSLIYAAIVLAILGVCRPLARADETTDYINQIYQDQAAQNSYMEQLQQTQDYINQIYQDQAAQNSYMDQLQQTQDYINQIYQDQKQTDDYLNSIWQNQ